MRKIILALILIIVPFWGYAGDIPQPAGLINDFAKVIDKGNSDKIGSLTKELEEKTNAEIAVVTVESIAPYDEKEYARLLFDNWKPGKKGKDNGVLVLLAVKERRWRIETGYGVEGILPDGLCGEIGRNYMAPYFKEGKYGEGLYQGVRVFAGIIAKDAHVVLNSLGNIEIDLPGNQHVPDRANDWIIVIISIMALIFIIRTNLGAYRNRRYYDSRGYYGDSWGGGFGGGGGGFGGFGGGGGGGGGAGGGF